MNSYLISILSISFTCSIVCLITLLIKKLFGKNTGALWRSFVWILVLLRLAIPIMIESPIGILNNYSKSVSHTSSTQNVQASDLTSNDTNYNDSGNIATDATNTDSTSELQNIKFIPRLKIPVIIFAIYLVGVFISFLLLIIKLSMQNKKIVGLFNNTDVEVAKAFEDVKKRMGIKTNINLIAGSKNSSPALYGLFKPLIIIPENASSSTAKELEYIFVHELTHYKQMDIAKLYLLEIVLCMHWFNPLLHIIKSTIVQDIELACDEKVLSSMNKEEFLDYGTVIANYSTNNTIKFTVPMTTGFAGKTGRALKERLLMIRKYDKKRSLVSSFAIVLGMMMILVSCTTFGRGEKELSSEYPTSFNWQEKGVITQPQNQGESGTGGIFAAVGVLEASIARQTGELINLSEQNFINETNYWEVDKGVWTGYVLDFLVENGVVKDENLPFTGVKDITAQTKGKVYKLDSWGSIDVSSYSLDERKEIIKKCLLENGPIVTTISFYNDLKDYSGGIYECDESSGVISGHWVTIVGWSDDDSIASEGYWIVKESWGPEWGDGGYCKIAYGDASGIDDFAIYFSDTLQNDT